MHRRDPLRHPGRFRPAGEIVEERLVDIGGCNATVRAYAGELDRLHP
jgi:hypothetical protein